MKDDNTPSRSASADAFWTKMNADSARFSRAVERRNLAAGRAADWTVPPSPHAPCFGQTAESVAQWLKEHVAVGATLVIRQTQYDQLRYIRAVVTGLGKGRFRVTPVVRGATHPLEESYYYSGKHCFHPKGQTRLVAPTPEVLAAADELAGATAGVTPDWVFNPRETTL
jgi:hypothetical protein